MARILFGSIPLWGHISPTIAVAQKLMNMGHIVAYASHPDMNNDMKKANISLIDTFRWQDLMIYLNKIAYLGKMRFFWKLFVERKFFRSYFVLVDGLEQGINDFLKVIDEWKPDVCVFDVFFHPGMIAAEIRHIPFASSCASTFTLPSKDLLPYSFGFPSYKKKMTWEEKLKNNFWQDYCNRNKKFVNKIRKKHNLEPTQCRFFDSYSPYLYLAYTTSAFEFERSDLLPQVYFIGPSVSKMTGNTSVDFPWDWIDDKPIVYLTMGTIFPSKKIIDMVIKASADAPWKLIVSVGKNLNITENWPVIPKNVLIRNWVYHPELFKKTNLIVCHGGSNTVEEALMSGLPILSIPQQFDHFETAQRVVEAGAGLRIDPSKVTVTGIRSAISELLKEASYRENSRKVGADFSKCDGPASAATLILKLADKKCPLFRPKGIKPTLYKTDIDHVMQML
jgi:MGT family glycosyltransferase